MGLKANASCAAVSAQCRRKMHDLTCKCYPPCNEQKWEQILTQTPGANIKIYAMGQARLDTSMYAWMYGLRYAGLQPAVFETEQTYYGTNYYVMRYVTFPPTVQISEEYAKQNVIVLKVFVSTMDVTTTVETKDTSLAQVLGNIGGNAGLTIGVSLMTLFEWVEFLLTAFGLYVLAGKTVGSPRVGDRMFLLAKDITF